MKKLVLLICVMILGGSSAWSNTELNQLQIFWQDGEAVLQIKADGPFQFRHEIAEAKDGKPYRVVVDLFPAVHNLSQKNYRQLPSTILTSIRTSQYAVQPTATARVVLDLKKTVAYRIEKKGNSVYLYLPYDGPGKFASWTSGEAPAKLDIEQPKKSTTVAEKPKAKNQKTQPVMTAQVDKPASKPDMKKAEKPDYHKPESSSIMDRDNAGWKALPPTDELASAKFTYSSPESSTVLDKDAEPEIKAPAKSNKQDQPTKPAEKKAAPAKKDEPFDDKAKSELTKSDKAADQPAKPKQGDYKKVKKSEVADNGTVKTKEPASKETADKKESKETSHFRRKPAFPNKLKGTIVAQFPTRMVIKYKAQSGRDPFATLIDSETGTSNDPLQMTLIPDVETSRLVGVLESTDGQNRALLEDMEGHGYIVKKGDKVKKGYVSKIYANKALFQIFEYGWSRTVALRLEEGE